MNKGLAAVLAVLQAVSLAYICSIDNRIGRLEAAMFGRALTVSQIAGR